MLWFLQLAILWAMPGALEHPIHLSVTEFFQEKGSTNLGMSITLFMDDLGEAINYKAYEKQIRQGKMKPEALMERYLKEKLTVHINGQQVGFSLDRTETNMDAVTCYLRLQPQIRDVQHIRIENRVMLELFDDQRNMIQIQLPGKKSGMISLDKKKISGATDL